MSRATVKAIAADAPVAAAIALGVVTHLRAPADGADLLRLLLLVGLILACAFRAMKRADELADHFGEPLGTIILTVSAITIEVAAVCAIMLGKHGDPQVARDTMFSVLMLILNLLLGLALLAGCLRRGEQEFNPQSSGAYLPLIIALAVLSLVLPRFTTSAAGGWMSTPMEIFVAIASIGIYGLFLWMQTTRHRDFFAHPATAGGDAHGHSAVPVSPWRSGTMLVLSLAGVVLVAEGLAGRVHGLLERLSIPNAIGGVFIAALVLAPEAFAALRSARRNDMQRSVNILLGSALSTIGLTVPAVLAIRFITGSSPELGLDAPSIVLLLGTFLVAAINLGRGRVNALQGFVHLLLFLAWIATILDEGSAR
ncbi:MAG: hypothetical protein RIS45_912 [Planctomycetota bacterium]